MTIHYSTKEGRSGKLLIKLSSDRTSAENIEGSYVTVTAKVTLDGEPVDGCFLAFTVDGLARFHETESNYYVTVTNGIGEGTVRVKNKTIESNTVICMERDHTSNNGSLQISFHKPYEKFNLCSVSNANHTMYENQPSIAWSGAEFFVRVKGGSSKVEWSALHDNGDIELEPYGMGCKVKIVSLNGAANGILAADMETKERVVHPFSLRKCLLVHKTPETLNAVLDTPQVVLANREDYIDLCKQWGDLSLYSEWFDGEFWTSDHLLEFKVASIVNAVNGTYRYTSTCGLKLSYAYTTMGT